MPDSDSAIVIELIHAFRYSKIMFVAVSLGIFDLLGNGPRAAHDLARAIGADADALERLLNACVGLRLLRKDNSEYANEPVAQTYLRRDSDSTLTGYVLYSDRALYPYGESLKTLCVMAPTGGSRYLVSQVLFLITSSKPKQLSVISLPACTASDCSAHLGSSRLLI